MSDFGELCPLFNTGVFHELLIPDMHLTLSSATVNAMEGLITAGAEGHDLFTFGRTVVITDAYCRRWTVGANGTIWVHLKHYTSAPATPTIWGTFTMSETVTQRSTKHAWNLMTSSEDKTFTSDEVLGIGISALTAAEGGEYDFIIRYKEK